MNTTMNEVMPIPHGKNVSGIVTLLTVHSPDGVHVGRGFVIWDWITDMHSNPIVSNFHGNSIPMGQFTVNIVEERLAVISFNIH